MKSQSRKTTKQPPTDECKAPYYVWVHGIFGIYIHSDGISLVSPDLTEANGNVHIYRIGRVRDGNCDYLKELPVQEWNVMGLPKGKTPPKASTFDIDLPGTFNEYSNENCLKINLPWPDGIFGGRLAPITIEMPDGSRAPEAQNHIALVHVLRYCNADPSMVEIEDLWGPYADSNHLHFFVEPKDPMAHTPSEAVKSLLSFFTGVSLVLRSQFSYQHRLPAPLSNTLDIADDLREQFTLLEWSKRPHDKCCDALFPVSTRAFTLHPGECPNAFIRETKPAGGKAMMKHEKTKMVLGDGEIEYQLPSAI